jgi:hypothetical protein
MGLDGKYRTLVTSFPFLFGEPDLASRVLLSIEECKEAKIWDVEFFSGCSACQSR